MESKLKEQFEAILKALIEDDIIRNGFDSESNYTFTTPEVFHALEKAYKLDREEWISVGDRLPDREGYYLTWVNGFSRPLELYWNGNCFATTDRSCIGITHYHHLPNPPHP